MPEQEIATKQAHIGELKARNNEISQKLAVLLNSNFDHENLSEMQNRFLSLNQEFRKLMQNLQEMTGTKIEPQEATLLLDKFSEKAAKNPEIGLIWQCCPGAGGYDDIVFLTLGDEEIFRTNLQQTIDEIQSSQTEYFGVDREVLLSLKLK